MTVVTMTHHAGSEGMPSIPQKILVKIVGFSSTVLLLFWGISQLGFFAINLSDSIPYKLLWIHKTQQVAVGNHISFYAPGNGIHPDTRLFTKPIVAGEGDVVEYRGHQLYINDRWFGSLKETSRNGLPLLPGYQGQIPKGHYFVYARHPNSLDSRYRNIGLVHESDIVGRAKPIF